MADSKGKGNQPEQEGEILYQEKSDRRLLSYVPDKSNHRSNRDRRGIATNGAGKENFHAIQLNDESGRRYLVDYQVKLERSGKRTLTARATDISMTGMLLTSPSDLGIDRDDEVRLSFEIKSGSLPEGYEMKVNRLKAYCMRAGQSEDGSYFYGIAFDETIAQYANKKRRNYMLGVASFFCFSFLWSSFSCGLRQSSTLSSTAGFIFTVSSPPPSF